MELTENLQKATILKEELDGLRPLFSEQEKRIMQKFRLDWNYHSSHIEGNSLTYGETKALILFGHTAQAKPLKDHLEMSGHDEAILYIEDVIKQTRPLTESFIRDLHKLILKQPYQVDVITPDGQPTKRWVKIGSYKTVPNHVKTKTGEIFYFASPEETPAKMADLMKWYSENIENKDNHPAIFATEFHYRFIRIHPFDDGNGRIARLLMNFILLQFSYPPAIIKTENKNEYYNALEQADAGQLDFFFNYISEEVVNSLDLMLRGARGEEIEEPEDLDKKLQLLKKRFGEDPKAKVTVKKSPSAIKEVIEKSLKPLITSLEKRMMDFDTFFKSRNVNSKYDNGTAIGTSSFSLSFNKLCNNKLYPFLNRNIISYVLFESSFNDLRKSDKSISIKGVEISFIFHQNVYEIKGSGLKNPMNKLYNNKLEEEEIAQIVNDLGNWQYGLLEDIIDNQSE
ncbi:MAG: Fic family protein [Mariniphaga sp.]|nr:Fic family protein [Mariniphaga sp.]